MQLYAVNFIPLLGSLYMFRVFYTPIIRSTIFKLYLQPLVQTILLNHPTIQHSTQGNALCAVLDGLVI